MFLSNLSCDAWSYSLLGGMLLWNLTNKNVAHGEWCLFSQGVLAWDKHRALILFLTLKNEAHLVKNHNICSNGLAATILSSFSLLRHLSHLLTLSLPSLVDSAYNLSCKEVPAASEHVLRLCTGPWQDLAFLCGTSPAAFCQLGQWEDKEKSLSWQNKDILKKLKQNSAKNPNPSSSNLVICQCQASAHY